jgi:membrane protease subunit (stomatin/prohibitin family)
MVGGAVSNAVNAANQSGQPAQPIQPAQPADDMAAFKTKVEKLTIMKQAGIISEEEFAQMKAKLLSEIL